ncbi:MAG: hypothetical protein Q7R89_02120 [bacterium]|nr:hypothetical protein [bacterium]
MTLDKANKYKEGNNMKPFLVRIHDQIGGILMFGIGSLAVLTAVSKFIINLIIEKRVTVGEWLSLTIMITMGLLYLWMGRALLKRRRFSS